MYFYREEERKFQRTKNLLAVSDGKVLDILHDRRKHTFKIVVFLNIFDQHQQYYPTDGVVVGTTYKKGTFHPAYALQKSNLNERMTTTIRCDKNHSIVSITQIAGQIARRIVNKARKGERVRQGERLGMIKFSSRVDVVFSSDVYTPSVEIGQKLFAKKTILATIKK